MWRNRHLSLVLIGALAASAWAADASGPASPPAAVPDLFGQGAGGAAQLPNPQAVEPKVAEPAPAKAASPARESSKALPELIPAPPADPTPEPAKAVPESAHELKRGEAAGTALPARGEGRAIDRRAGTGTAWRWTDTLPLLVVLGIIIVIAMLVRRFMPARIALGGGGAMEVLARVGVAPKQQLVLVRLGRRVLLLGVSPERMTTLCIVDDPDQVAALIGEVASGRHGSVSNEFRNSFDEEAGQYLDEPLGEDVTLAAGGQVRGLLEKVRKLTRGKDAV